MPIWLSILLSIAVKVGLPLALRILRKLFPNVPWSDVSHALADYHEEVSDAKKEALRNLKMACSGAGCPADTKEG